MARSLWTTARSRLHELPESRGSETDGSEGCGSEDRYSEDRDSERRDLGELFYVIAYAELLWRACFPVVVGGGSAMRRGQACCGAGSACSEVGALWRILLFLSEYHCVRIASGRRAAGKQRRGIESAGAGRERDL